MTRSAKFLIPVFAVGLLAIGCGDSKKTDTVTTTASESTSSASSQTQSQAATTSVSAAPCTKAAVMPQLQGWAAQQKGQIGSIDTLKCDGQWAAAIVNIGGRSGPQVAVNVVLKANGSSWSVQNRATVCANQAQIPASLQSIACNSN